MARRFRLDLRPVFRRFARQDLDRYAQAIRSARPKERADGKPVGGSLPKELSRAFKLKSWGYVLQLSKVGQKLTWFVRGTKRQRPRPVRVKTDASALAAALAVEATKQFDAWDRGARA